jgi:hypothetical protein
MAAPDPRQRLSYGQMRASAADKEQVIGVLKDAFVEGRLTQDEQAERAGQAMTARTYAELARLTEDLPVLPPGHPFPRLSPPAALPPRRWASPMAVAALVLALVPGITAPVGFLLGLIALSRIRASGGRGRWMASAAVLIGGLFTLVLIKGIL